MSAMNIALILLASVWSALADRDYYAGHHHVRRVQEVAESDIDCMPLLKVTEYGEGTSGPEYEWQCQLLQNTTAAEGKRGKILAFEDLENLEPGTVDQFESGWSLLTLLGVTTTSKGIKIPKGAKATLVSTKGSKGSKGRKGEVNKRSVGDNFFDFTEGDAQTEDNIFHFGGRRLQTVARKVLVIRVKMPSSATTATVDQLSDSVFGTFGDQVNLKSQYDACSFGKLTFEPLLALNPGDPLLDADGVYEVEIGSDIQNHVDLREAITDKLNADFANTNLPDNSNDPLDETVPFSNVLYCMPPGVMTSIACECC